MSMSNFKFWGWDKKPRTMLRFVKPGDIFCFRLEDGKYCFGRIIAKIMTGHVAEFFDYISDLPEISENIVVNAKRLFTPVVIDTYGLFDKRVYKEGDWRFIGCHNDYKPANVGDVFFTYGIDKWCKKVDVWGNEMSVSAEEAKSIPDLSPHGDYDIKQLLKTL